MIREPLTVLAPCCTKPILELHINTSVHPSVRPSVRPSVTKFSQDWIISFFLILYMVIGDWRSQIFEKKFWQPEFGLNGPKSGPKQGVLPFFQVWFIIFPGNCIQ